MSRRNKHAALAAMALCAVYVGSFLFFRKPLSVTYLSPEMQFRTVSGYYFAVDPERNTVSFWFYWPIHRMLLRGIPSDGHLQQQDAIAAADARRIVYYRKTVGIGK